MPAIDQSKRARGSWGEDRAVAYYRTLGFEVVSRNWRSPEREVAGELDIVVRRGSLVVFCEVKARRGAGYGGAAVAVVATKQERIRALASSWLRVCGVADVDARFDVIAIEGITLRHYESAF